MESQTVMGMAGGFIALAIMLGIGTSILGGAITDCASLDGAPIPGTASNTNLDANIPSSNNYDSTGSYFDDSTSAKKLSEGKKGSTDSWAYQCATNAQNAQNAYSLLMVSLIVMGAAIVLLVVRFLTG